MRLLSLTFISSADGQYNDLLIIYHLYISPPSLLVLYVPHTASGRMIFSFLFQIARFSLDLSLCTGCVGFVSVRYCAFITSRTGLDRIGLDWTLSPSPHGVHNSTVSCYKPSAPAEVIVYLLSFPSFCLPFLHSIYIIYSYVRRVPLRYFFPPIFSCVRSSSGMIV